MLLRSSAALRWRVLRGKSLSAAAKRAGEMGVASLDILDTGSGFAGSGVWGVGSEEDCLYGEVVLTFFWIEYSKLEGVGSGGTRKWSVLWGDPDVGKPLCAALQTNISYPRLHLRISLPRSNWSYIYYVTIKQGEYERPMACGVTDTVP